VDWAVGAVHCIRRSALDREAPYSERSFMYMEDMEICWHVRSRGWLVRLEPSSVVRHTGNVAGERAFGVAREERWIDALYDWYVAEHGPLAARGYAAATCLGLLVKAAVLRVSDGPPEHKAQVEGLLRIHSRRILRPRSMGLSRLPPP
jgi:GT2 family glycosyltransferase